MLREVYPEPLRCAQGRSQRNGERAQHDNIGLFSIAPEPKPGKLPFSRAGRAAEEQGPNGQRLSAHFFPPRPERLRGQSRKIAAGGPACERELRKSRDLPLPRVEAHRPPRYP